MPARHQWIFDVLKDLRRYAQANGLPALAHKAEEALLAAKAEIAALPPQGEPGPAGDGGGGDDSDGGQDKGSGIDRSPGRRDKMH